MADNNHLDFGVDLLPATTEIYNLGTSGKKWNNIYGKTIYSNGTKVSVEGHTHTLSIATDTGTNALTFTANSKYKLTAGGSTYIFTT
jgi:hypothetical protein